MAPYIDYFNAVHKVSINYVQDATEPGIQGKFKVSRILSGSHDLDSKVYSLNYEVTGTATEGVDYSNLTKTVTFQPNELEQFINIDAIADIITEGNEDVVITLLPNSITLLENKQSLLNVIDDPVSVTITKIQDADENGLIQGKFEVARLGALTLPIDVALDISGTGVPGTDYIALPSSITIPANQNSIVLAFTPIDNTVPNDRTVIVNGVSCNIKDKPAATGTDNPDGFALAAGGYTGGAVTTADKYIYLTKVRSAYTSLSTAKSWAFGVGNTSVGYVVGGSSGGTSFMATLLATSFKYTYSNSTIENSTNLYIAKSFGASFGNGTNGYMAGGYSANWVITKLVYDTGAKSNLGTTLSFYRSGVAGASSGVAGYAMAGDSGSSPCTNVDKLVYATEVCTQATALSVAKYYTTACGNKTIGLSWGGMNTSVDPYSFETDTNMGTVTMTRASLLWCSSTSNGSKGLLIGGWAASNLITEYDYVAKTFVSNAVLGQARCAPTALSSDNNGVF